MVVNEAEDRAFMRRALDLALRGRGRVEPNPMVGCVIVADGRVIGEGFHQQFGGPHAEPAALAACTQSPAGASVFVTLEPCCHTGKKTPPCVPALIAARVGRVVAACEDPNPAVSGQGLRQLAAADISTAVGLLAPTARQINAPFFSRILSGRPYVTLKWVQSADGRVAGPGGARRQISSPASMRQVHELRARCDAILVGIGTALADDPLLTARGVAPSRPLTRIVLDTRLRLPLASQLVRTASQGPVVVFCGEAAASAPGAAALRSAGVEVIPIGLDPSGGLHLPEIIALLGRRGMTHVLVDAGPKIAAAFMRDNLADRVWVFHSPIRIDASDAPTAPSVAYPASGERVVGNDRLVEMLNPKSPAFYALAPSADLILAGSH